MGRQDRTREALGLAVLVDPPVAHSWGFDRHCARAGRHLARARLAVTGDQGVAVRVAGSAVSL